MSEKRILKIAFVVSSIEVGGVETYMLTLAARLGNRGHEVFFVETGHKGRWSDEFRRLGHQVLQLTPHWYESKYRHAMRIGDKLSEFDTLFLNNAPMANPALGMLPSNILVMPVLHLKIPTMIADAIANFEECSQLVIISPTLQDSVVATGNIKKEKLSLICNGVEVLNTFPFDSKKESCKSNFHIGYLGRIEHGHKGVLNIPAILQMYEGNKDTLKLSIIGDGPDMKPLKESLAKNCSWLEVKYYGFLPNEEAKDILATFDVLLMPSYYEGLPIALLEAMALGVIPVVSRIPDSTDIVVKDGENGFISDPDDFAAFACALSKLGKESALREKFSRSAWETIVKEFNAEKMTEQYLNLMARLRSSASDRQCSGSVHTDSLGEFPNLPLFLAVLFRKFHTLYRLVAYGQAISHD